MIYIPIMHFHFFKGNRGYQDVPTRVRKLVVNAAGKLRAT